MTEDGFQGRALESLLGGVSLDTFYEAHWNRRVLHVPGAAGRFDAVYRLESWRDRVALADLKAARTGADGVQVAWPIGAAEVDDALRGGATVCAEVTHEPRLATFLAEFHRQLRLAGGLPFAKVYASGDQAGFAVHFDAHHVFVLQISGSKEWRVSTEPAVRSPLLGVHLDAQGAPVLVPPRHGERACADDGRPLAAPDMATFETFLLKPGDLLYLPPGAWHTASARGHSVAVSISPAKAPLFTLFLRALEDRMMQSPEWRADVTVPPWETLVQGSVYPSAAKAVGQGLEDLGALCARLDRRVVERIWRLNLREPPGPVEDIACDPPAPHEILVRRCPLELLIAPDGDRGDVAFLYAAGSEWALPLATRPFVEALAKVTEFRADAPLAWDPTLSWQALRELLQQLLEARILARRDE